MQPFEDEEQDGAASPTVSSENDREEPMEDAEENEIDADGEPDQEADADNDDDNEEEEQDDTQDPFLDSPSLPPSQPRPPRAPADADPSPTQPSIPASSQASTAVAAVAATTGAPPAEPPAPTSHPNPTVLLTSPSPHPPSTTPAPTRSLRPSVRPEALTAKIYDIVPTIAAPHSTSINAVTSTPDLRWVFTGGADGYIRKFNWIDTANGKVMLTVAQRHPFVDSVTKAGVLMSYWENEEPQDDNLSLSAVYSLAVHSQGLWLLSGLESGGINLQSVRHDEGKRITCLRKHTSAVSVLTLADDEKSVLSGSWDKNVYDWDLHTGQVKRGFDGSGGQISAIEARPLSALPVPAVSTEAPASSTLTTNNAAEARTNGVHVNGADAAGAPTRAAAEVTENGHASPADSLFGGDADSLFGDNDDGSGPGAPSGGNFGEDDDDEFSRAIAHGIQQGDDDDGGGDVTMVDAGGAVQPPITGGDTATAGASEPAKGGEGLVNGTHQDPSMSLSNGLPHSEDLLVPASVSAAEDEASSGANAESPSGSVDTFLAASIDGTLRVWDRRQPTPVACILPRNVPPWCMNACWSPDGNSIYAGRRNGTVEEFNLHKGLRDPERTFRFPHGSGPVSAVKAMPNGRHLICASFDILRLYDLGEQQTKHSTVPFLIVPGHRGGVISSLYIDPTCHYLISTAGNRGWEGSTTEVLLGYEIGIGR
ncbi:MAG: Transcription factor spt8 [Thelocarpon superellum]|nr:MAG: Transcription factor spt8 [Thelocarpon superellum]